jgi:putative acyl-CoA dehydrogenase
VDEPDCSVSWPQDNVAPPWSSANLYLEDPVLRSAFLRHAAGRSERDLLREGARTADPALWICAREADLFPPRLERFDARGRRVDRVSFHPSWHRLLAGCVRAGLHGTAWLDERPGAQVVRAASYFLHARSDAATLCPTTMTHASVPLLQRERELWAAVGRALVGTDYDSSERPLAAKTSGLVGMGLTEIQGGSDLRQITTRAIPVSSRESERIHRLIGRKWFLSVPQSDAHLILARDSRNRFGCYYVPRVLPDGRRNRVFLERLKDKVGNRGNATAEAILDGAWGYRIGEADRGLALLMEMASTTRLDNVLGSAALLRQGLSEAVHHARRRRAFGRRLVDQPLMISVLADLALESAAATCLSLDLAALAEERSRVPAILRRLLVPATKFWVCKRTIAALAECAEVLGGNGYVEDSALARMYREAPVNSIWEGSGNVVCLDVLRGVRKNPEEARALFADLERGAGGDPCLVRAARGLAPLASRALSDSAHARVLAARLVLTVQALELRNILDGQLYEPFVASRLAREGWGAVAGLKPVIADASDVLEATVPEQR